ncbi:hypothetical protein PLICRDRAFT_311103 [Plicaturopsis crispa FD-325 SS-3]|nr:hypothetical protein PLICRDRAFT_311103 [Plicaturopsis crispa FD-325 SS-3]
MHLRSYLPMRSQRDCRTRKLNRCSDLYVPTLADARPLATIIDSISHTYFPLASPPPILPSVYRRMGNGRACAFAYRCVCSFAYHRRCELRACMHLGPTVGLHFGQGRVRWSICAIVETYTLHIEKCTADLSAQNLHLHCFHSLHGSRPPRSCTALIPAACTLDAPHRDAALRTELCIPAHRSIFEARDTR